MVNGWGAIAPPITSGLGNVSVEVCNKVVQKRFSIRKLLIPPATASIQSEVENQYRRMSECHERAMAIKERLLDESGTSVLKKFGIQPSRSPALRACRGKGFALSGDLPPPVCALGSAGLGQGIQIEEQVGC